MKARVTKNRTRKLKATHTEVLLIRRALLHLQARDQEALATKPRDSFTTTFLKERLAETAEALAVIENVTGHTEEASK